MQFGAILSDAEAAARLLAASRLPRPPPAKVDHEERREWAPSERLSAAPAHWREQSARSQAGRARPRAHSAPHCRRAGWRLKQVIAAPALCLLLVIVPLGQCQNSSTSTTPASQSGPTTTAAAAPDQSTPPTNTSVESHFEPTQASQNGNQPNKLKPVNFTLVDELFEATLDEPELIKRWRNMDAQFQEGIRSILKLVFPQIVAVSQDAKVSGDCSGGILKWILSLRNLRSWAIKMLDATGKPTSGIFEGSLTMFGNHRQCLSIRAPDEDEIEITDQFEEYFRGQFCVLHMRPWLAGKKRFYNLNSTVEPLLRKNYKYYEKTLYDELAEIAIAFNFIDIRMDLCVPSTCTMADIQRVADLLSRKLEMRAKVMRCDIESRDPTSTLMQNMDLVTVYWLALPLTLVALTLFSSLLVFSGLIKRTTAAEAARTKSRFVALLYCLSIQGTCRNLFNISSADDSHEQRATRGGDDDDNSSSQRQQSADVANRKRILRKPLPLYGLRSVFVIWFVIVQLTVELDYQYLRESLVLRNMMLSYWPFQVIINTSMIFESLILITAFTFSYANLESGVCELAAYVVQKYVRLISAIITLIMITIITPTIGLTSPVWKNFVDRQASVCKSTGQLNLFFLQNFISFDKICLPHTWLFCVEMQLIVLTIPLVLVLKRRFTNYDESVLIGCQQDDLNKAKNRTVDVNRQGFRSTFSHLLCKSKAGVIGLLLVLAGAIVNFTLVYTNQLPPAWFHTFPDADHKNLYFGKYLTKSWTHLSTFIIGLYAGHLCRAIVEVSLTTPQSSSKQVEGRQIRASKCDQSTCGQAILKLAAIGCLVAIVFSTFTWSTADLPSPLISALFDSLSRLVWSLALSGLMIKLCLPNQQATCYVGLGRLFSHPLTQVLGRLSFLAYLIAPYVHTLILALQEQSLFPSLYLIFHVILGNLVIIYLLALVLSILIERPLSLALRQLFRHCSSSGKRHAANEHCQPTSISSSQNGTTTTSATSLAG